MTYLSKSFHNKLLLCTFCGKWFTARLSDAKCPSCRRDGAILWRYLKPDEISRQLRKGEAR